MLYWRKHRCARIVFSLNFHLGKWTGPQCVEYLIDRVGHERAAAEGEVRRSLSGGYGPLYQAAYMLGGLQLRALHDELCGSGSGGSGSEWTEQGFHDAILRETRSRSRRCARPLPRRLRPGIWPAGALRIGRPFARRLQRFAEGPCRNAPRQPILVAAVLTEVRNTASPRRIKMRTQARTLLAALAFALPAVGSDRRPARTEGDGEHREALEDRDLRHQRLRRGLRGREGPCDPRSRQEHQEPRLRHHRCRLLRSRQEGAGAGRRSTPLRRARGKGVISRLAEVDMPKAEVVYEARSPALVE
jgi:hypothetical protein